MNDATGDEQSSTTGNEQPSITSEEQISATGEEQLSTTGEEQNSTTGEEQISTTGDEQISTTGREESSITEEEPPSTTCNEQSSNIIETDPLLASLRDIAMSGNVEIQWEDLQKSLKTRLEQVIEMYQKQKVCKENQLDEPNVEKFNLDNSRDEIMELIESFTEPPFTIQRICELLSWPLKYYDRVSTFLRGLEKNLRVISSNDWPKCQSPNSLNIGEAVIT